MNKAASLLALSRAQFTQDLVNSHEGDAAADKRSTLRLLRSFEDVLDHGVSRITPMFRSLLVEGWLRLAHVCASDDVQQDEVAAKLVRFSRWLTWPEEKPKLLERFDSNKFDQLPPHRKTELIRALFRPLDIATQCVFVKRLQILGQKGKLDVCLECMEKMFVESDRNGMPVLWPDRIDGASSRNEGSCDMDPDQRARLIRDVLLNEIIRFPEPEDDHEHPDSDVDNVESATADMPSVN